MTNSTVIEKYSEAEFDAVIVSHGDYTKYYISSNLGGKDNPCVSIDSIRDFLQEKKAQILNQDFFGSCSLYSKCMTYLAEIFGEVKWPITWVEGNGKDRQHVTGTQIYAVSGVKVVPIYIDGRIAGNIFESEDAHICTLGGILPDNLEAPNKEQAAQVFNKIEDVLKVAGMKFSDVVRTWLYVNNILDWYDEFNEVRTQFFNERKIFDGLVPASTGIGVANPSSAALVAEVMAIKRKSDSVSVEKIKSPLQCPAIDYKSSFSRAVEVKFSGHRRLYISGTASINDKGNTIYKGNVKKQITKTMEVVKAILDSRGMDWSDASRAIAYFPDLSNSGLLEEYLEKHSIKNLPVAIAHGDICRADLLYEIEIDAVKKI